MSRKKTREEFISEAKRVHGDTYDDKGNKIEGDYITLMKKEYDNIE